MRKLRVPLSNFQFGEVSPSLISRTDSKVYSSSAQKVENFFLRAEGGADLDGDESFVYFGGKSETGEGFGMKKSFKEMFRAQKDEYIIPKDKSKPVTPAEKGKYLSTIEGAKELENKYGRER